MVEAQIKAPENQEEEAKAAPQVEEPELYSSDEEKAPNQPENIEKKISEVECENKENPHEDEDFSVMIDKEKGKARCINCVIDEFAGKEIPSNFVAVGKFMK